MREAAIAVENVASTSCSGHGRAYFDSLVTKNGRPICECNACFAGLDCSVIIPNCAVDADSWSPMFLEPFWKQNAGSSSIMVAGWHRMGYEFEDAFAWLKCEANDDKDCHYVLRGTKNIGQKGAAFGVENRYVRLSVVNSRDDFDLLQQLQQDLLSKDRVEFNCGMKTSKELWNALKKKYKIEDAGMKTFFIVRFLEYKMIDSLVVNETFKLFQ
ncbi:Tryptophan aminotransferase-related protein 4 [Capsicum baccatum]|uniref:Tryptophan aminotransferase-related protein 4 n=1 Tax=Capsicum baccatum TaxID=33114 RepID=A0A2G2WB26_CAPBA|nr:Tryptophan aminotransferase-related protein 4 [Capsicum baccatum]